MVKAGQFDQRAAVGVRLFLAGKIEVGWRIIFAGADQLREEAMARHWSSLIALFVLLTTFPQAKDKKKILPG